MDIGLQIKKLRAEASLSQEELADKVYVSRQTISNWENDKNYPDIKSLLLLSELFDVSLDILVKGDIEIMKQEIRKEDQKEWKYHGSIWMALICIMLVSGPLLFRCFDTWGMIIWGMIVVVALCYSWKMEKLQKKHNIHTYKEVVAFMEGKSLTSTERQIEKAKRPYQTLVQMLCGALVALVVCSVVAVIISLMGL